MTIAWILIIFAVQAGQNVDVETVHFSSEIACEEARAAVADADISGWHTSATAICVRDSVP